MPTNRSARRGLVNSRSVVALLLLLAARAPGGEPAPTKQPEARPAAPHALCGQVSRYGGLRVLELWGTREQAGYAHGFLLAPEIRALFDDYVFDERILAEPATYELMLRANVRRMFAWPTADLRELEALLRGARDRLGRDAFRSEVLSRPLELDDLLVINALSDWFGFLCSSVSVWGPLTEDGRVLTGRNLDFPYTEKMRAGQIVIFNRSGSRPHAGVSWPGLIGVYSGFSDAGVTMLIHDSNGLTASESLGFAPRALVLRQALEAADERAYIREVGEVFARHRVMVGNNVHVSGPAQTETERAAIFEYDGNGQDGGLAVRRASANGSSLRCALWCTNHMRLRREPRYCWRHNRVHNKLTHARRFSQRYDVARLFSLMASIRQEMTLHSVVFDPEARTMHVLIPAIADRPVTFVLPDWLGGRLAAGG